MPRTLFCGTLLLLAGMASAQAEHICDIERRWEGLINGERLTISGRIVKDYGPLRDGNFAYDIADSCGEAAIEWDQPIDCRGTVTITGEYDESMPIDLLGQVFIWVTQASCN